MIPCFICGQDASTGWIQGFSPAPDSQKMALCALHDNEKNRKLVALSWQGFLRKGLAEQIDQAKSRGGNALHQATVRFLAGGMLSFLCTQCEPTPQGTLRIVGSDGQTTFIPMQHVREFTVKPYEQTSTPEAAPSPASPLLTANQPTTLSAIQESEANKKALLLALGENGEESEAKPAPATQPASSQPVSTQPVPSQPEPFTDLPVPYGTPFPEE